MPLILQDSSQEGLLWKSMSGLLGLTLLKQGELYAAMARASPQRARVRALLIATAEKRSQQCAGTASVKQVKVQQAVSRTVLLPLQVQYATTISFRVQKSVTALRLADKPAKHKALPTVH